MAHRDDLEHYEATEARDFTRLLRALRPPERDVPVPPPVDFAIRAAIWQGSVRRQLSTLLALAHRDLVRVLRQALRENPLLEEGASEAHTPWLTAAVPLAATADLAAAERYDSLWQACVPDGWEAPGLPVQASEAASASAHPSDPPEAPVPDVIVRKVGHDYQVRLNDDGMPRLRLSATSRRLFREGHMSAPEAMQDLDDQLRAAVWLIRSLEYRRQTLLQVATSLVTRQRAFLDHGLAHLKPLVLKDVAEDIGMHESTVSRVTTNKYMYTEQGIFELKSFFHSGIELHGGGTISSLTVKDRIKTLVAAEDPGKPLTDQQLVEVLAAEYVKIARRTVTQYRRELKLAPAHRRQRGSAARGAGPVAGASRLSPDEEQRVRQALFRRWQADPPLQRGREEASGGPPEDEEPRRRRDDAAAASLHQWVEQISGIDVSRLAADPEACAAYRDLQTALAHPPLRPAVLLALRAFAQAAQAGATISPPADAMAFPFVELGPSLRARPDVKAPASVHDLDQLLQLGSERVVTLLDTEGASVVLLEEARQEPYFTVAYDSRASPEQRLRGIRFPADQGIAGWVIQEGQSLIVPDVDQDPRHYRGVDDQTGTRTRSIAAVPLRTRDRTIGVLEAINKINGVFTIEDVRLLEAFANQLAPALENERLIQEWRAAQERLSEENRYWREAMVQRVQFETLVGESPRMQEVYRLVKQVLHATTTVLLTGERGTGQELIARVIHYEGPRAKGPFIAVNCAATPETLLEAELFGYERGAFTGATQRKPGRFELAAGGTLFLDEIGDVSPVLQVKLLRVLQERQFERVGGTETLTLDARIVAATNQDLERLVAEGKFRRDLYYRLNLYPITLPPLRERQEDLGPLTMYFLKRFSQELRKEVLGISKEAMGLMERYPWPGNVRELEEVIGQAVAWCQGPTVTAQDLPQALWASSRAPVSSGEAVTRPPGGIAMADLEQRLIRQALEQAHGNQSLAARQLGLSRTQLRTRMRQHGLETG